MLYSSSKRHHFPSPFQIKKYKSCLSVPNFVTGLQLLLPQINSWSLIFSGSWIFSPQCFLPTSGQFHLLMQLLHHHGQLQTFISVQNKFVYCIFSYRFIPLLVADSFRQRFYVVICCHIILCFPWMFYHFSEIIWFLFPVSNEKNPLFKVSSPTLFFPSLILNLHLNLHRHNVPSD